MTFGLFQQVRLWELSSRRRLQAEGNVVVGLTGTYGDAPSVAGIVGQGHYTFLAANGLEFAQLLSYKERNRTQCSCHNSGEQEWMQV